MWCTQKQADMQIWSWLSKCCFILHLLADTRSSPHAPLWPGQRANMMQCSTVTGRFCSKGRKNVVKKSPICFCLSAAVHMHTHAHTCTSARPPTLTGTTVHIVGQSWHPNKCVVTVGRGSWELNARLVLNWTFYQRSCWQRDGFSQG